MHIVDVSCCWLFFYRFVCRFITVLSAINVLVEVFLYPNQKRVVRIIRLTERTSAARIRSVVCSPCRLNENPTFPAIAIVLKWFGMKTRFIAVGFFPASFRRIRFWFIHAHIAVHILEFHRHLKVIRNIFRLNMIFHYERERFRNDYQLLQSQPSFNVTAVACEWKKEEEIAREMERESKCAWD